MRSPRNTLRTVLDVKGEGGMVVTWRVETGPMRPIANGREVTFADGRNFFLGTSAPDEA